MNERMENAFCGGSGRQENGRESGINLSICLLFREAMTTILQHCRALIVSVLLLLYFLLDLSRCDVCRLRLACHT